MEAKSSLHILADCRTFDVYDTIFHVSCYHGCERDTRYREIIEQAWRGQSVPKIRSTA